MPDTPHEDRFIEVLQYLTGRELAQEVSIPRKARRLDAICRFDGDEVPAMFGALSTACADRAVLFEHESAPLSVESVASAWVGLAWLTWHRVRTYRGRKPAVHALLSGSRRPPLAIIVADGIAHDLTGAVPGLALTRSAGLWSAADSGDLHFDNGGLIVVDTSAVPAGDGYGLWQWFHHTRDDADANARLVALLDDPLLPMLAKQRFLEAMMDQQFNVSDTELETASQRVRREGREEGREEGRMAILALAARVVPEMIPTLQGIEDLEELQRAADAAIVRKLGR